MGKEIQFECVECGFQSPKFYGRCPQCQNWNSFQESVPESNEKGDGGRRHKAKAVRLSDIDVRQAERIHIGIEEFDRLLGGGLVRESVVLIGGEPGVGKSTLLLQVAQALAGQNLRVLYYSGEESSSQIKLRAQRVRADSDLIFLLSQGTLEELREHIDTLKPQLLIIDSIQTIHSSRYPHAGNSTAALRQIAAEIIDIAKSEGLTVFLIGHITKEGQLAGPKTLEHMVDVVLYFQGEIQKDIRILRSEKNRFGSIHELGLFRMTADGLTSISDPSQVFIQHRLSKEPGISIFPTLHGQRILLIEIQALVSESPFVANPRRISLGFDSYKMAMLISIIEKKLKFPFYKSDVFLNITGGLTIHDTAADLAICAVLVSNFKNIPIKPDSIFLGEVGLTGEIRPIQHLDYRIKESARQGFKHFFVSSIQVSKKNDSSFHMIGLENLHGLLSALKS